MTAFLLSLVLALTVQSPQAGTVSELMKKVLPEADGKEALMITVDIAPGETVPSHRHNAAVFAYVLEGGIVTQLQGAAPLTLHRGESFYEAPSDIHLQSRNESTTKPAKLLVFFVKEKGSPPTIILTPDAIPHSAQ